MCGLVQYAPQQQKFQIFGVFMLQILSLTAHVFQQLPESDFQQQNSLDARQLIRIE